MVIRRQRQRPQRALLHPMLVHEALHLHGKALRRRHQAIRNRVRPIAGNHIPHRPLPKAPKLPLRQRPKHDHTLGHPGSHRRRSIGESTGATAAPTAPLHVGKAQIMNPKRRRQPRRITAVIRKRRKPIHLLRRNASILTSRQHRHQRQLELRLRRLPPLVVGRLPHPSNGHRPPQTALHDLPPSVRAPQRRSIARHPAGRHPAVLVSWGQPEHGDACVVPTRRCRRRLAHRRRWFNPARQRCRPSKRHVRQIGVQCDPRGEG